MKPILSLTLAFLAGFFNLAFADSPVDGYKAEKVAAHTWVIHGPRAMPNPQNRGFMNNPAFVITDKSVVVIDPGSSRQVGEGVLAQIREITDKPVTHVFDSHVHGDHWLGNQAFRAAYPKVKLYAHPAMIEQARAGEAESWVQLMETLTGGATKGTEAVIPDHVLTDNEEIRVDDMTIRVHLGDWAHTKTDAMFEVVEDKVLFTGDTVTNQRMPRMDDGSFRGSIKIIDAAQQYPVDVVVPGHGPTGGKELLTHYRKYLNTVYTEAAKYMDEGLEPYEMKEKIAPDVAAFSNWSGFDEEFGKHVSLAVLEAEQAGFE